MPPLTDTVTFVCSVVLHFYDCSFAYCLLVFQVEVSDYFGQKRRKLIQGGIGRPLFIALYEDKVYVSSEWGPQNEGRLFVASRLDGTHLITLEQHMDSVQGERAR